ncbi:SusD/RagB family nutrient-binding outer membrane lipoprotein, partial [Parabacteroides sp. OttesenSCG-928-O15]|nr:SusD/RagB family nutrient-binding outer membrane lipoprotein [Parabacteroides sp. OttesenSCG-928-O15]
MKNRWNKGVALLITAFMMTACTGSFDEINTDPDAYASVPHTNVLGYGIRNISSTMGNDLGGYGTWAGYINKIQYPDFQNGIIPSDNTYGNRWSAAYNVNMQFKNILALTEEDTEGNKNLRAVCRIWQNYNWAYLLDG